MTSSAMSEDQIRILLIDPTVLFRTCLGRLLSAEEGIEIGAECDTFSEALRILQRPDAQPINLAILDFELGSECAVDFIPTALEAGYAGRFLVLASDVDVRKASAALSLGVGGIFLKSDSPPRLIHAIREIMQGDVWIDPTIVQILASQLTAVLSTPGVDRSPYKPAPAGHTEVGELGERETTVLLGVIQGLSNKEIGTRLGMSEGTAKNVIQRLFSLTGVRSRSQLVRLAFEGSFGALANGALANGALANGALQRSH